MTIRGSRSAAGSRPRGSGAPRSLSASWPKPTKTRSGWDGGHLHPRRAVWGLAVQHGEPALHQSHRQRAADPLRGHLELDEVASAGRRLEARHEALLRLARRQHLAKDVPVHRGSRGELRYDLLFDGHELRAGGLAGLQA